ncbi:hypothetical protein PSPO01_12968 [Paraphaeosphaeria sporulosa]
MPCVASALHAPSRAGGKMWTASSHARDAPGGGCAVGPAMSVRIGWKNVDGGCQRGGQTGIRAIRRLPAARSLVVHGIAPAHRGVLTVLPLPTLHYGGHLHRTNTQRARGERVRAVPDKWLDNWHCSTAAASVTTGPCICIPARCQPNGRIRVLVQPRELQPQLHISSFMQIASWATAHAMSRRLAKLFAACKLFVDLVNRAALSAVAGASFSDARRAPMRRQGESKCAFGAAGVVRTGFFAGLSNNAHVISRGKMEPVAIR